MVNRKSRHRNPNSLTLTHSLAYLIIHVYTLQFMRTIIYTRVVCLLAIQLITSQMGGEHAFQSTRCAYHHPCTLHADIENASRLPACSHVEMFVSSPPRHVPPQPLVDHPCPPLAMSPDDPFSVTHALVLHTPNTDRYHVHNIPSSVTFSIFDTKLPLGFLLMHRPVCEHSQSLDPPQRHTAPDPNPTPTDLSH